MKTKQNKYWVLGIIKSKYKYANVDAKTDTIKATNLEGAINKFKKKYPKYIVFSVKGDSFSIWYNKDVEEEYEKKYGGKV